MMNVSKYRESGRIHKNGTEVTSWHSWLVVASSINEPQAASASQSTIVRAEGFSAAVSVSAASLGRGAMRQTRANATVDHRQSATNAAYAADQASDCIRSVNRGSKTNG